MKTRTLARLIALNASLTLSLPSLAQNNQSIESFNCSTELSVIFGDAFQASCTGDLTINSSYVVEAVESISISSDGNLTHLGTLVAPNIRLSANGTTTVAGGLFSGSSDSFPVVTAISQASGMATVSTFENLVSAPFVHPIYGAVTFTIYDVNLLPPTEAAVIHEFTLTSSTPEVSTYEVAFTSAVPEPSTYAMLGVGLLALLGRISMRSKHSQA